MRHIFLAAVIMLGLSTGVRGQEQADKPAPRLQALPQPYHQVSFQRDEDDLARYHFGRDLRRPFVFPLIGPSGRSLTRMGHPRDPESHSHHNSVWISHNSVNGLSFWDDRAKGRIVHQRIEQFEDLGEASWITTVNHWIDEADNKVLIEEHRRTQVQLMPENQFMLIIDLRLQPRGQVVLDKTPFGMIGVRMAKTIGTHDGGGVIRNSSGMVNEKDILWKQAKWVDYSGPTKANIIEGVTLMDHPSNPNHPTYFHVRGDGWMGSSLTYDAPRTIEPGSPLTLRYGVFVHAGRPAIEQLEKQWAEFARTSPPDLSPKR